MGNEIIEFGPSWFSKVLSEFSNIWKTKPIEATVYAILVIVVFGIAIKFALNKKIKEELEETKAELSEAKPDAARWEDKYLTLNHLYGGFTSQAKAQFPDKKIEEALDLLLKKVDSFAPENQIIRDCKIEAEVNLGTTGQIESTLGIIPMQFALSLHSDNEVLFLAHGLTGNGKAAGNTIRCKLIPDYTSIDRLKGNPVTSFKAVTKAKLSSPALKKYQLGTGTITVYLNGNYKIIIPLHQSRDVGDEDDSITVTSIPSFDSVEHGSEHFIPFSN